MRKQIEGFDYRVQQPSKRPTQEWKAHLREVIEAGGRRRVENGETFAHDAKGVIVFEIYGRV